MITGKMYLLVSNDSIEDRIKYLIKDYSLNTINILYLLINIKYGKTENLENGDVVGGVKIRLSEQVMPDYFWFIVENKDEKYQNLMKIKKINENLS